MMALFLLTTCRNIWHPQDPIFWSGYLRLSMLIESISRQAIEQNNEQNISPKRS
jgi:hypothetical protein